MSVTAAAAAARWLSTPPPMPWLSPPLSLPLPLTLLSLPPRLTPLLSLPLQAARSEELAAGWGT